jgi:copper homeostasis protein
MSAYQLEVIAFTIESCGAIEQAGAHRIELCDNPGEGGTTPSYGFLQQARAVTRLPLFPIIRPRGGDFVYSTAEFNSMLADVSCCKALGCDGVVLGILQPDGQIDAARCAALVRLAYPMEVTFHRAFDRTDNPETALETVIDLGFTRILSSGGHPTAMAGATVLRKLIEQADDRIEIMPGSGVRSDNIVQLATLTGARAFHTSARTVVQGNMQYHNPNFNEDSGITTVDPAEVKATLSALASIAHTNTLNIS